MEKQANENWKWKQKRQQSLVQCLITELQEFITVRVAYGKAGQ